MEIGRIAHKGLKRLIENDDASKLPADYVGRIRELVDFLLGMERISDFFAAGRGKPHMLKGARKGVYAISVFANWRITFRHDPKANEIFDLDFEDYH